MTQYNSVNVKLLDPQPNKLKSATKTWNWTNLNKIVIKYDQ